MEFHLFWGQKVKGQGHEAQKHCPGVVFFCTLASAGFFWSR